jgi:hypothetical protein
MSRMQITFTDEDGVMTFEMNAEDTRTSARTTLQDTEQGVDIRTVLTDAEGNERTVVDKLDRRTAPLNLMMGAWEEYSQAFLHNAQAAFNKSRYERLQREGKPITMQTMCMDGAHTSDEYANIPFRGGIVGVPEVPAETGPSGLPEPQVMTPEDQDKVRAMLDWLPTEDEEAA